MRSRAVFCTLILLVTAPALRVHAQTTDTSVTQTSTLLQLHVRDATGAPVGADVLLLTADRAVVAATRADDTGTAVIGHIVPGRFLLVVRAAGFAEHHASIDLVAGTRRQLDVILEIVGLREEITVTATSDAVDLTRRSAQPVNVIDEDKILLRATTVVAQAVTEEPGLQLQRTSPTMAGVYVRGLTGNKVSMFVDGVRYSNGAQRGGVNTFLDLIEPASLEVIEVLRGPNSAQYGSDAIGGSLQFLSRVPSLSFTGAPQFGGEASVAFGSADRHLGGYALGSYSARSLGVIATLSGRDVGTLRPGRGIDSHAAVTRFFDLRSDALMPSRLPDTEFSQWGGSLKANWVVDPSSHLVAQYRFARQNSGKRYDQLLGGDGNLIADLRDLGLDFASVRFERLGLGWFDDASVTYSFNTQREERVNQGGNGNPRANINYEPERTSVQGVQGSVSNRVTDRVTMSLGGDVYFEGIDSPSYSVNPVTEAVSVRRGRIPDGAAYRHGGLWAQAVINPVPDRLRLIGNLRYSAAAYRASASDSPLVNGEPLWPDDALSTSSVTFRAGIVATPSDMWTFSFSVSRGFRAPHMTDLGTLGLTGSGFEVAAPDVAGLDGTVGTTAGADAVSTGRPVEQVGPESSLSFDGGVHFRSRRFRTNLAVWRNNFHDSIEKQSLILPPGAVGTEIAGEPIVAQATGGAVFVAASTNPVLTRTNFFDARFWGVEHGLEWKPVDPLAISTVFSYVYAEEVETGLPPNIEGGTPPADFYLLVRYTSPSGRWWVQPYGHAAGRQTRLSSLDLADRRTGATRNRANIRSFFYNGATVRGWVSPGPDGVAGTADDLLIQTGETVGAVQNRVLGPEVASAPLFTAVPGYVTLGVRGGVAIGRHSITMDAENLTDHNYRGISWGLDGPGRGLIVRYGVRF